MKAIGAFGIVLIMGGAFVIHADSVDREREAQYAAYNACMHRVYGVSTTYYYSEHGTLPDCN